MEQAFKAEKFGSLTFEERVELAKSQIIQDVIDGYVEKDDVRGFSDLHDYFDANHYGFTDEEWDGDEPFIEGWISQMNEVQKEVDKWIKGGWADPPLPF